MALVTLFDAHLGHFDGPEPFSESARCGGVYDSGVLSLAERRVTDRIAPTNRAWLYGSTMDTNNAPTSWLPAFSATTLSPGNVKAFRHGDIRAVITRSDDGSLNAVAAACPHEGYTLAQGHLKECVLTCAWHNFKFDVRTGAALIGDESLVTFPVRERDGMIEVQLAPPDLSRDIPKHYDGLATAIFRGRLGQAIRDTARLLHAAVPAADVLLAVVAEAMARSEYGGSHTPALAADLVKLLPKYGGIEATLLVSQVIELAIEGARGLPRHELSAPSAATMDDDAIIAAVECEDLASALGGLSERLGRLGPVRSAFERLFLRLSAAHFLDFGHAAIYSVKVFDLLQAASPSALARYGSDILAGLLRGFVTGTREDTLPPWKRVPRLLAGISRIWGRGDTRSDTRGEQDPLLELEASVLNDAPSDMLERLRVYIHEGIGTEALALAIMSAGAKRLAAFDPAIDVDPTVREGWLFVTHVFTHAEAVLTLVGRLDHPDVLRHLVYAAFFVNRYRALDRGPAAVGNKTNVRPHDSDDVILDGLLDALASTDGDAAERYVRALCHRHGPEVVDVLRPKLRAWYLDDPATRPIVVTHLIKVFEAALVASQKLAKAGFPDWEAPLIGAVRFMAGPIRERTVARTVNEAIALVRDGKTPHKIVT